MMTSVWLGSISNRFVSPRSLPHTTAGSLVYALYFLTNHSKACSNRAGFPVIGQFCHSSIQHGGCQCRRVSFCYKVCFRALYIDKFRETHQHAILNFLKAKDVLVSQPTASGKFVIFQYFPIFFGVVYGCNR